MFFQKEHKLSPQEAKKIIILLKSYAVGGHTILSALKLAKKAQRSERIAKILSSCINEIDRGNRQEEVLYFHGFVNEEEKEMLSVDNPKGIADSLEKIEELREYENKFEKIAMSIITPPLVMLLLLTVAIVSFGQNQTEYYNGIKKLSGASSKEVMADIDSLVWYFYNPTLLIVVTLAVYALFGVLLWAYLYYKSTDRTVIYKFIHVKGIDDMPRLLQIIKNMEEAGLQSPQRIMEKLSNFESYKGLKRMFIDLRNSINYNEKMHFVFEDSNFPKELVVLLESGEAKGDFFSVLPEAIKVSKALSKDTFERMKRRYGYLGYIFAMLVLIYFVASSYIANFLYTGQNVIEMIEMMGRLGRI